MILSELGEGALIGLSRLTIPLSLLTLQGDTCTGYKYKWVWCKHGITNVKTIV